MTKTDLNILSNLIKLTKSQNYIWKNGNSGSKNIHQYILSFNITNQKDIYVYYYHNDKNSKNDFVVFEYHKKKKDIEIKEIFPQNVYNSFLSIRLNIKMNKLYKSIKKQMN
jgi:hypothetical protein